MLLKFPETDYQKSIALSQVVIEQGVILPYKEAINPRWGIGGVVDSHQRFVPTSAYSADGETVFGGGYDYDDDNVLQINETVVFLGHTFSHWGSFLIDHIARLWYILDKPQQYKIAYCGIGFEAGTLGTYSEQCYAFFNMLGIKSEQLIDIRTPTRFDKVIVPELSFYPGKYYYPQYGAIFEQACRNLNVSVDKAYEKIYFTRCQFLKKKEIGEKQIEKLFSANGFKVLAPEKLSISEQIFYIQQCTVMVSLEGTIAHNVLFASTKMSHQVIIRKQSELNPRQPMFNKLKAVPAIYIDAFYEPFKGFPLSHDDGPFLLHFNGQLKRFANDNQMQFNKTKETVLFVLDLIQYTFKCVWMKNLKALFKRIKSMLQ